MKYRLLQKNAGRNISGYLGDLKSDNFDINQPMKKSMIILYFIKMISK